MSAPVANKSATIKTKDCSATTVETKDVVDILISNSTMLNKWSQFSDLLNCPPYENEIWEREIKNGTCQYYDIFSKILKSWTSRNLNKTVHNLAEILKQLKCVSVAEKLEAQFRKESILQPEQFSTDRQDDLSSVETKDVVDILISNSTMLNKWSQFSDLLNCPPYENEIWEREIKNGTCQYYDIFSKILKSWTSRNLNKTVHNLAEILKQLKCVSVAEKLEAQFRKESILQPEQFSTDRQDNLSSGRKAPKASEFVTSGSKMKWPITHGLLVTPTNFSGREDTLKKLNSYFNSKTNLILICGFGGIGKTELCKKFANDIASTSNKSTLISRIWLHGETFQTLRDSVLQLAKELGIKNEADLSPSEYFEYLTAMMLENCDCLLVIIDNIDVKYPEVEKVIKSVLKADRMFVVVTSRDSLVLDNAGITIPLGVLTKEDARGVLQASITGIIDSEADNLANILQYFPLALQQAIAYIKQQRTYFLTRNYSVSNYVKEFEMKKAEMLEQSLNEFEHGYSLTTLVTWDMTFSKMSLSAFEILKIVAYLDPDRIDLDFLEKICRQMDIRDFEGGLNMIFNYCFVKFETIIVSQEQSLEFVSVHRLVQEVVRGKIDDPEYLKMLFDSVFLGCGVHDIAYKCIGLRIAEPFSDIEIGHLKSVYKFIWKPNFDIDNSIPGAFLFLLDLERFDCAIKLTEINFPHIKFSSELSEKEEFAEKVLLWIFLSRNNNVTSEMIQKGEYNVYMWRRSVVDLYDCKFLKSVLKISQKYFGEQSKLTFCIKDAMFTMWLDEDTENFDTPISLCEEFVTFSLFEHTEYYLQQIYWIIYYLTCTYKIENEERTCFQIKRIYKIIDNLCEIYPHEKRLLELKAKTLDLKRDYEMSLELFTQLIPLFKEVGDERKVSECRVKLNELKIKLIDLNTVTKEEIEREFGGFDYRQFSLPGLERILVIYVRILGDNHPLTVRVKIAILINLNWRNERRSVLRNQVLDSSVEEEYKNALRVSYGFAEKDEFVLQSVLKVKESKLGKTHSNTLRIRRLLGKTMEREGRYKTALKLFQEANNSAGN